MYVIVTICTVIAALVAVGLVLERRRRRLINEIVAAMGGQVVAIRRSATPTIRTVVDYIGPQGELRQASLQSGETQLSDDQPFQLVLRDAYQSSPSELLATLKLVAQYEKLPGFKEYQSLMRRLAAGTLPSVSIRESPGNAPEEWRFAPILQCLEAVSISSQSASAQTLKMKVNNDSFDINWSVAGAAPSRTLVVVATRSQ